MHGHANLSTQFPTWATLLKSWMRLHVSAEPVDRCLHGSSLRVSHAAMYLQAGQNIKEATGNDVGSQAKSGVRLRPPPVSCHDCHAQR